MAFRSRPTAMVVSLAGTVAISAACTSAGPGLRDGPLVIRGGSAVVGFEVPVGQRVAYGFNVMRNTGTEEISNLAATLLAEGETATTEVTFEPVQIVPIGEAGISYLGAGPWPFEETAKYAQPLQGKSIPAHSKDVELLFITTVYGKVDLLWPKTRVEYDYGGERYVKEISNGFALCSPPPCRPRHE